MARRIIRTIDRQVFSDRDSRFENRKGYILYRRGLFNQVRISNRGIISDDTSGPSGTAMMVLLILVLAVVIIVLFLSRTTEVSGIQNNANVAQQVSPEVIVDETKGVYYSLECAKAKRIKTGNKITISSEKKAQEAKYKKARNRP